MKKRGSIKTKSKKGLEKPVNILFTSVSNEIPLLTSFREAYASFGISGNIVGVDVDPLCSGLYLADKGYIVPHLDSPEFFKALKDIIRKECISLIIPTRDEDLIYFSENKEEIEKLGAKVMISPLSSILTCSDKWRFYRFLKTEKIPFIQSWLKPSKHIAFPCIIKPRTGKGSIGFRVIKNRRELDMYDLSDYIIQEKIDGTEYTIDYFSDFAGKVISVVPRVRVKVVNGESRVGITKNEADIIELVKKTGRALGLIGHNTFQCFRLKNGTLKMLEINPRFGGGAPLGIKAGCNSPEFLFRLLCGEKLEEQKSIIANLVMLRYSKDLFVLYDEIIAV